TPPHFNRGSAREAQHSVLGRRVAVLVRGGLVDADGVNADDTAPASGFHPGQHRLSTEERSFYSRVELLLPLGPSSICKALARNRGGIVADQSIYLAKDILSFSHHVAHVRLVCDIGLHKECPAPGGLDLF